MATLYIVIPCYNEEEVLPETNKRMSDKLGRMISAGICDDKSRILFVNDGSRDNTWKLITKYHNENPLVCGINLAHNKGHQNAVLAGLLTARKLCDCAVSIDADLQDDIEVLDKFMECYHNGCDIVYGVRNKRDTDTFFKRTTAHGFYKFMKVLGVDVVYDHADYRLMSRRALDALNEYKEVNLFLRGIVPQIGYKTDCVYYDRSERFAGESKYPLKKMLSFALDGVTSFSVKPLKFITNLGIFFSVISVLALIYALVATISDLPAAGWIALVASIWLIGGITITCIGIVGGYIGKIYSETKARPRFIIESFLKR